MRRHWYAIAKAEYYVATSRFRRFRFQATFALAVFGIIWALYIVPAIVSSILQSMGTEIEILFRFSLPQLMRTAVLFIWIMVLVYPISYALQEIRIGQWEIMLSNNVSTRDMMMGTFLGRIPTYGLLVLFMAPIAISPFALFFHVSIIGQLIMYLVIVFVALSTLLLSNVITTAIQAKLGESSRGDDIAKALGMVVAIAILIPMYGIMYFAGPLSDVMGMSVWLLFPFTWGADLISWSVILFNGVNLTQNDINIFNQIIGINVNIELILLLGFTVLVVGLAFVSADRLFTFAGGARTEKIVTVGEENFIIRSIRGSSSSPSRVLLAITLKDFSRKVQNISRLMYGVVLAILMPIIFQYSMGGVGEIPPEILVFVMPIIILMLGMMMAMIAGFTFGGIGFLESKDQLWIIKSAPRGAMKYTKARLLESFIMAFPISLIPAIGVSIIFSFNILDSLSILGFTYLTVCGATLFSTGITANNPNYENQKSSAFYVNTFASIFGVMIIYMFSFFSGFGFMITTGSTPLIMLISVGPLLIIGIVVCYLGVYRMSKPDSG